MRFLIPFLFACSAAGCQRNTEPEELFDPVPVEYPVDGSIKEASGICQSMIHNNHLWVHEDSGNPPQLILLQKDGKLSRKFYLDGAVNVDWEDISRYSTAGKNYLAVGDIGDNNRVRNDYTIYLLEEPSGIRDTVQIQQKIRFTYIDGPHDAEAFIVEPATLDIWIFTKENASTGVYKLSFPYSTTIAEKVFSLPQNMTVAASLSADGKELLLKSYFNIYYYPVPKSSLLEAIQKNPVMIPYQAEPQGEAICFGATGFFTLSEGAHVSLREYRRK